MHPSLIACIAGASALLIPQFPLINLNVDDTDNFVLEDSIYGSSKPLVTAEDLAGRITTSALKGRAERLYKCAESSINDYGHPTRVIGSQGHKKTLEYIYDTLGELDDYFDVTTQALTTINGFVHSYSLKDGGENVTAKPFSLTPSSNGTIEAELFVADNFGCKASDFKGAANKIALVKRGQCPFGEKAEFAGLFDALAVLVYDPNEDLNNETPISGDLGLPLGHQVATLGVLRRWAEDRLEAKLSSSPVLTLHVDAEVKTLNSVNVIAETKEGDHNNVVMLGSHSDSVYDGPGMNDNGSGLNTLLEVAKQLSNFRVKNAVRLAWWTAEEEGLIGSLHYTRNLPFKENAKIRLFMDYDMMASPNYGYEIYDSDDKENPAGSSAIRDMYIDFYKSRGLNYTLQPFDGRSDYVGFLDIGIPAGGFDAGVEEIKTIEEQELFGGEAGIAFDKCYHQACDDLDNVNYEAWQVNAELVAYSAGFYANSLEGFPERTIPKLSTLGWRRAKSDTA